MSQKIDRANAELQKEIANIIVSKIRDPRLEGAIVSVVYVDTSADLSYAKVGISIYNADVEEVFEVINKAKGFVRKQLASCIKMRIIPQLVFVLDKGMEHSQKINNIINNLNIPNEEE